MNQPTPQYHFCLYRRVPVSLVVLACLCMLSACAGTANYPVNGELDIQTVHCDVDIPDQVKVHAELFNGDDSVGKSGTFGSNGPFNLTIPWPESKGQPEGWRVTAVTRLDGTEICTREGTCGEGKQCLDMATKVRCAALNSPITWRVRCKCIAR